MFINIIGNQRFSSSMCSLPSLTAQSENKWQELVTLEANVQIEHRIAKRKRLATAIQK